MPRSSSRNGRFHVRYRRASPHLLTDSFVHSIGARARQSLRWGARISSVTSRRWDWGLGCSHTPIRQFILPLDRALTEAWCLITPQTPCRLIPVPTADLFMACRMRRRSSITTGCCIRLSRSNSTQHSSRNRATPTVVRGLDVSRLWSPLCWTAHRLDERVGRSRRTRPTLLIGNASEQRTRLWAKATAARLAAAPLDDVSTPGWSGQEPTTKVHRCRRARAPSDARQAEWVWTRPRRRWHRLHRSTIR